MLFRSDTSGEAFNLPLEAKEDIEVMVARTGGSVGNLTYSGQNLFSIFANNSSLAQGREPSGGKVADGFYVEWNNGSYCWSHERSGETRTRCGEYTGGRADLGDVVDGQVRGEEG